MPASISTKGIAEVLVRLGSRLSAEHPEEKSVLAGDSFKHSSVAPHADPASEPRA
jgi:hypothetical protein